MLKAVPPRTVAAAGGMQRPPDGPARWLWSGISGGLSRGPVSPGCARPPSRPALQGPGARAQATREVGLSEVRANSAQQLPSAKVRRAAATTRNAQCSQPPRTPSDCGTVPMTTKC